MKAPRLRPPPSALALALCLTLAAALAAQETEPGFFALGEDEPVPGLAPGMSFSELGDITNVAEVNLQAGDELMSGLLAYVEERRPPAGTLSGIGGFASALFAWYDPEKGLFREIPVDMKGEVVSFTGAVSYVDDEPSVHVHALVSFEDGSVRGGHLVSARIAPIMQVFVFEAGGSDP